MRRRRKKEEPHVSHERWLVSYADFITLLFAFFVVLYASSQVDKRRVGRLSMAIQVAFQELGVFDTSNTHIPLSDMEAIPFSTVQAVENVERTADLAHVVQPMKGILAPTSAPTPLKDIQAELEKALAPEIKRHVVDIKPKKEGLVVSLREMGFYESGSSTMRTSSVGAVDRLAKIIIPRSENLRIEGHTDNIPIHNSHFPSNWELSTARSTELVRMFIVRYRMDPNRLSAAGFAEFHPVDDNDTPEGRARNRRIDIVILNPALQEKSPFATPPSAPAAVQSQPETPVNPSTAPASSAPVRQ
jgi:chemotaxis protein MotB